MGVPAHDTRDAAFASVHGLPVVNVVTQKEQSSSKDSDTQNEVFVGEGVVIRGPWKGMSTEMARQTMCSERSDWIQPHKTYKLRDWLVSRQRCVVVRSFLRVC